MKLKSCTFAVFLLLAGCGGDAPPGLASSTSSSGSGSSSLIGTWQYTFPATSCVEKYTFNSAGTFRITSLDEVASGTYTTEQVSGSSSRYTLVLTYTLDNGGADCSGFADFDTGSIDTKYYELDSNKLNFFSSPTSLNIIRTYEK